MISPHLKKTGKCEKAAQYKEEEKRKKEKEEREREVNPTRIALSLHLFVNCKFDSHMTL